MHASQHGNARIQLRKPSHTALCCLQTIEIAAIIPEVHHHSHHKSSQRFFSRSPVNDATLPPSTFNPTSPSFPNTLPRPANPPTITYMTVHGIGMQQHSYPSHSKHFVFPAPASPLTREPIVDEAAEPGPLRFTSVVMEEEHILVVGGEFFCLVLLLRGSGLWGDV